MMKTLAGRLAKYPFLLLLLFLLIAYLPVFLPFFHIKNDLMTQNLPTRFIISESLHSGYFPWWNPYINFGLPQYGDMNNGYWNPILWLMAKTVGYNVWSITLEEMFYILAGGWGIYLLCKQWAASGTTALIAALSYMTSGFIAGHLQHFCWITGAAFFPYVLLYFFRINKAPTLKNYLTGSGCAFLFLASTHPGIIIGALYFFIWVIIASFVWRKYIFKDQSPRQFWLINGIWLLFILLFSLIVLVSDFDLLRHILRVSRVSLEQALLAPTPFPAYLSLLFPLAALKAGFLDTDITMRNAFVSILLLMSLAFLFRPQSIKRIILPTLALLFFAFLSAGGTFKTFAYYWLPLTGHVRLNGEFNYFVVLILLLAGAAGLEISRRDPSRPGKIKAVTLTFAGILTLALLYALVYIFILHDSALYAHQPTTEDIKLTLKHFLDATTFPDLLLVQSLIQLLTLAAIRRCSLKQTSPAPSDSNHKNSHLTISKHKDSIHKDSKLTDANPSDSDRPAPVHTTLITIVAINLILTTWATLPFTGLGMASKASRQQLLNTFPKGIHAPELLPLNDTRYLDSAYENDLILLGSYSKKIGYLHEEMYPVEMKTTKSLFYDTVLFSFIKRQPYLFLSADTTLSTPTAGDSTLIQVKEFGPGKLRAVVDNTSRDHSSTITPYRYLTFLQNDYPYWTVKVNGRETAHFTGFRTFITLPIQQGRQEIEFSFDPRPIKKTLLLQLLIFAAGLILLSIKKWRNKYLVPPVSS